MNGEIKLESIMPQNPIKLEETEKDLIDLARLENLQSREALELLQFFNTKSGRDLAVIKARKARYEAFIQNAVFKEEIAEELEESP